MKRRPCCSLGLVRYFFAILTESLCLGKTAAAWTRFFIDRMLRDIPIDDEAIARVSMKRSVAGNIQERGLVGLQPVAGLGSTYALSDLAADRVLYWRLTLGRLWLLPKSP
jgi:hypothetical protein